MANSRRKASRRRVNRKDRRALLLFVLAAVLVFFVLVMPKNPIAKAVNASADGTVSVHAGLRISEVMSDNVSALPDENRTEQDKGDSRI